jgi:hypothetical protein
MGAVVAMADLRDVHCWPPHRSPGPFEAASLTTASIRFVLGGVVLLNRPVDRPWGMRTASFTDPAGHIWEVAQDLD